MNWDVSAGDTTIIYTMARVLVATSCGCKCGLQDARGLQMTYIIMIKVTHKKWLVIESQTWNLPTERPTYC